MQEEDRLNLMNIDEARGKVKVVCASSALGGYAHRAKNGNTICSQP